MRLLVFAAMLAAATAWAECPPLSVIEGELVGSACSDSLISGPMINPPIGTLVELEEQVSQVLMPLEDFAGAFGAMSLGESGPDVSETLMITYDLASRSYQSWAYLNALGSSRAALIIPGSGPNQSRAIFRRNPANYHYDITGTLESEGWDTYIYIKPNEDCLAIHNSIGKLSNGCLVPRLLNSGGSYSARYLVDAIAWVKHLKQSYARVVVIGLSQGGTAALVTALESVPDGAFVASGWSVLSNGCSGLDQLILPGRGNLLAPSNVLGRIQAQRTKYAFSWGLSDNGAYEYDAKCGLTAEYLGKLRNVTCISHDGGHEFCQDAIASFLRQFTAPGPEGITLNQNVPNPFTESTLIGFSHSVASGTQALVFDSLGRLVRAIECERNCVRWDGRDTLGQRAPAGVYTCRLGDESVKMVLVR
jgi:hypothetical protein